MSKKMSLSKRKPRIQYKLISPTNIEYIFDGRKSAFDFANNTNISISFLRKWLNKGKIISKSKNTENCINWEFITIKRISCK